MSFVNLAIPVGAKVVIVIVFIGNLITIACANSYYPFYDVGMFRWSSKDQARDTILYCPKYYYYKEGEVVVLDLRKESVFFMADHFGFGYTHEFTFSTTYHNKGQRENFEFIAKRLHEEGVDTLWVGIQKVNYFRGIVTFDPDLCQAIHVNATKKIYYGPLYIPEYQLIKCKDEH